MILVNTILLLYFVILAILVFIMLSNQFSIWLGAPPISSPVRRLWRDHADRTKTFLDIGCGAGLVCLAAAADFKHVYGIEYSPWYYLLSRWRTRKFKNVTIIYGDITKCRWPETDYLYCYLTPALLDKLAWRLDKTKATILALDFPLLKRRPSKTITSQKHTLYIY